jgi:hypothetical protein
MPIAGMRAEPKRKKIPSTSRWQGSVRHLGRVPDHLLSPHGTKRTLKMILHHPLVST